MKTPLNLNFCLTKQDKLKLLKATSQSKEEFHSRVQLYSELFGRVGNMRNNPLVANRSLFFHSVGGDMSGRMLGVALTEASLKAYIVSFAPYLAKEHLMKQVSEFILYKDKITQEGVLNYPLLGVPSPRSSAKAVVTPTAGMTSGDEAFNYDLTTGVTPGSVTITLVYNGQSTVLTDDRNGKFNVPVGSNFPVLTAEVTYATGDIALTFDTLAYDASLTIRYNPYRTSVKSRIHARERYFSVDASEHIFDYEIDIIKEAIGSAVGLQQSTLEDLHNSVHEEQLLSINSALVNQLIDTCSIQTDDLDIDCSAFSLAAGEYASVQSFFGAGIEMINAYLSERCWKAINCTALLVSKDVGRFMSSFKDDFVKSPVGVLDGLLGFYGQGAKKIPVLVHSDIAAGTGYAVIKQGGLAPVVYGTLLPATDFPTVGNVEDLRLMAGGIYTVDGVNVMAPELVAKFNVTLPSDFVQLPTVTP